MSLRKLSLQAPEPEDVEQHGLTGFSLVGKGKSRDDGEIYLVCMAWCALDDGRVAEIWFNCTADNSKGLSAAKKILNSLQSP